MNKTISKLIVLITFLASACTEEHREKDSEEFNQKITKVTTTFEEETFEDPSYLELLISLRICDPSLPNNGPLINGVAPCSPKYFAFYPYNHNRDISDAFILQVRKGVNHFNARRMLIFTRENSGLVKMNGAVGYLAERRSNPNGIDDLVVGIVDNVAGEYYRYDVLLQYENGKYHFVEALGDIEGSFENDPDLKTAATKEIGVRIEQKKLLF
jgi:hypothetical protein